MRLTELLVDLRALSRNVEKLRELSGGRDIIAAVKADAYGHGMIPVATHIEDQVAAFGVATAAEGETLRRSGINKPILKLSPILPGEISEAINADLTLVMGSIRGIKESNAVAKEAAARIDVHLKIDTGMHRAGVLPSQALEAARLIAQSPGLRLSGLMTHFACADSEDGIEVTRQQRRIFDDAVSQITAEFEVPCIHAANSAGIFNHDLSKDTAVRPGLALYGVAPTLDPNQPNPLEPIARWSSRVILLKRIPAGEGVSYGLTWRTDREATIATVGIGYGDGYSRQLSSKGRVLIRGRSYPVVGRVCMDQILVNIGDDDIAEGDEVVLMGSQADQTITVQEIADAVGTIPYEITCMIGGRVPRRYRH